jgi:hypothetical protein
MGHKFSQQTFLASLSPYFWLFGHELELSTSIRQNEMVIINYLDDPNV